MLHDPQSPEEWQIAVSLAAHVLLLDSLKQQGLITTGKPFDVERARAVLSAGAACGYFPPDDVARAEEMAASELPRPKRGRPRKTPA